MTNNTDLKKTASALLASDNILILTHTNPDGDTIGSGIALYLALKMHKKTAYCICDTELPKYIAFLKIPETETEPSVPCFPENLPEEFVPELIISVDAASAPLLGRLETLYEGKINFKIDHHATGEDFAEYNYTDTNVGSCGEIMFELLSELSALTPATGAAIYTAICTDTGRFQYSSVTPDTYRKAAELLEIGTDTQEINAHLYESRSLSDINTLRVTLNILHFYRDNTIAVLNFSNQIKSENGLSDDDVSGMSSFPRGIEGVELAITIKQKSDEPETFKISMRSGKNIDCSALCVLLGGGGHIRAAGASVTASSPEEAEKIILDLVNEQLDKIYDNDGNEQ